MKNNPTPAPKADYTSPESEVFNVAFEANIMSYNGAGGDGSILDPVDL